MSGTPPEEEEYVRGASKYIKLYSPANKDTGKYGAELILGDVTGAKEGDSKYDDYGVYIYTDADYYVDAGNKYTKNIAGHSVTTCWGTYSTFVALAYSTVVGGAYSTAVGGLYTSIIGGGKLEVFSGIKVEIVPWGQKYKIGKAKEFKLNDSLDFEASLTAEKVQANLEKTTLALKKLNWICRETISVLANEMTMFAASKLSITSPMIDLNGCLTVKDPAAGAIAVGKLSQQAAEVGKAAAEAVPPPTP